MSVSRRTHNPARPTYLYARLIVVSGLRRRTVNGAGVKFLLPGGHEAAATVFARPGCNKIQYSLAHRIGVMQHGGLQAVEGISIRFYFHRFRCQVLAVAEEHYHTVSAGVALKIIGFAGNGK